MQWYYVRDGQRVGPIAERDFEALVDSGKITPKTLVWRGGMKGWQKYATVNRATNPTTAAAGAVPAEETYICEECGKSTSPEEMIRYGESWICAACKPVFVQKLKEGASVAGAMDYGGFWIRLGAKVIDWIILGVINGAITFAWWMLVAWMGNTPQFNAVQVGIGLLPYIINAVYATWFVGRFGATPGKMACGLQVVTAEGGRVSYARALGRHFAEYLSSLILAIGYIMAAFDDQKRTLHDRICNTRVVRKS